MAKKPMYEELEQRVKDLQSTGLKRRQSGNDLDRFFNLSIDMLCIANMKGYFEIVNDSFEKTLQYSKQELYEHPFSHFVHPEDVDSTLHALKQLTRGKPVSYFENRYRCKDGSYKWLAWTSMPVREDSLTYAVARDITEIKHAQQVIEQSRDALEQRVEKRTAELRTANQRLQKEIEDRIQALNALRIFSDALENATDAIGMATPRGEHYYQNKAFSRLFGTIGTYPPDSLYVDTKIGNEVFKTIMSGEVWTGEVKMYAGDGHVLDIDLRAYANKDADGTIISLVGVHTDITGRKRAEQEKIELQDQLSRAEKMETIGTLAGGIAHDFNNILAAIMGYTELSMDQTPQGSLVGHNLEQIFRATLRARDLVKQILAFSRKGDKERLPVQLSKIVRETLQLLRASIPTTIEIQQKITSDALILADPVQIHQVLMNLATNASDAMLATGGVLEIEVSACDLAEESYVHDRALPPGKYLWVSVKDTGCGIAPENMARIFDPFFTTKAVGKGTGMGLAVVHGIMHSHDGAITVTSTRDAGTTFELFFPIIEHTTVTQAQPATQLPSGTETILLVDDEELLLAVITKTIESFGYTVVSCRSAVEALATFRKEPQRFDLVVTDQSMPKMTGYDLSKKLIETRPDLPIILCTGYSESVSPEQAKDAGIKEFVLKPVGRKEIAEIIRKVLDEKV